MVEKARILWIEDDEDCRNSGALLLSQLGHQIVRTAGTNSEALKALELLEDDSIQVAIVDGNLSPGDYSNQDGAFLAEEIKKRDPRIGIIGNAASRAINGADIQATKIDGPKRLLDAIASLPYPMRRSQGIK